MKNKQKKNRKKDNHYTESGEILPSRVLAPNLSVINGHVFCSIIATAVIVNEEGSVQRTKKRMKNKK